MTDEFENGNGDENQQQQQDQSPIAQQFLHGQVIHLPWKATGHEDHTSSLTPTLDTLLRICYAVHAWLEQGSVIAGGGGANVSGSTSKNAPTAATGPDNSVVALVCRNGQTKTALAAAPVLRFLDQVSKLLLAEHRWHFGKPCRLQYEMSCNICMMFWNEGDLGPAATTAITTTIIIRTSIHCDSKPCPCKCHYNYAARGANSARCCAIVR